MSNPNNLNLIDDMSETCNNNKENKDNHQKDNSIFQNDELYMVNLDDENNNQTNINNDNDKREGEAEGEGEELLKIQYISQCQTCREGFNHDNHLPYLMKCGHFFCKTCILDGFSNEKGVFCPNDGKVANGIEELRILNNLILDNEMSHSQSKTTSHKGKENTNQVSQIQTKRCNKHPDYRLTHYIENTKEVICVNCAFIRYKSNPTLDIKEVNDKLNEVKEDLNIIIEENQSNVEVLQGVLESIKENKSKEELIVVKAFDDVIKKLESKKEEYIDMVNSIFNQNADRLSEKLDIFSKRIEEMEEFKGIISQIESEENMNQVGDVIEHYDNFIKNESDKEKKEKREKDSLEIVEYHFKSDGLSKTFTTLVNCFEVKQKKKVFNFSNFNKESQNHSQVDDEKSFVDNKIKYKDGNMNVNKDLNREIYKERNRDKEYIENDINEIKFYSNERDTGYIPNSNNRDYRNINENKIKEKEKEKYTSTILNTEELLKESKDIKQRLLQNSKLKNDNTAFGNYNYSNYASYQKGTIFPNYSNK